MQNVELPGGKKKKGFHNLVILVPDSNNIVYAHRNVRLGDM